MHMTTRSSHGVTCTVYKQTRDKLDIWTRSVTVTHSKVVFEKGGDSEEPRLQAKHDTVDVHLPGKVVREVGQVHRGVHHRHRHVPVQQNLVQPPSQVTESIHYLTDEVCYIVRTAPIFLKSLDLLHVEEKELVFPVDVLQLVSDVGSRHRGVGRLRPNLAFEMAIKMTLDLQRKRVWGEESHNHRG